MKPFYTIQYHYSRTNPEKLDRNHFYEYCPRPKSSGVFSLGTSPIQQNQPINKSTIQQINKSTNQPARQRAPPLNLIHLYILIAIIKITINNMSPTAPHNKLIPCFTTTIITIAIRNIVANSFHIRN